MKRAASNSSRNSVAAAWGLELTQTSAELVRLERNGSATLKVQRRDTFPAAPFWSSGSWDPALVSALEQIPQDQPLAVCFPDRSMLCRGLTLPKTSAAATEKMVQSQANALFSGGDDRLTWTWNGFADPVNPTMQWILLCAAQRSLLEQLKRSLPAQRSLEVLVPKIMAVAPAAAAVGSALLVDLSDDSVTLALMIDGKLLRCVVVDRDPEEEKTSSNGDSMVPAWMRQARQSYQSLLDGIPRERWPKEGVLRAEDQETATKVSLTLSTALGIGLRAESADSGAAAAARLVLDAATTRTISFAANTNGEQSKPAAAFHPRRAAIMAAACVVAILMLYAIDSFRASWLTRQLDQLHAVESTSSGIERRLAVDRYLEKNASPALPGLDAMLGAAPPSLSMNSFGLNAAGQFHLSGILSSPNEVDEFVRKLQESKALTNVQLRSARNDQNRWAVELTADAAPMAGLLLSTARTPAPAPPPSPVPGAVPAPALAPTSGPATKPVQRGGK
jgi:hypothetical protein